MTTLEELNNTCPWSGKNERDCDMGDLADGKMSAEHVSWHTSKLVDEGIIVVIAQDIKTHGQNKTLVLASVWHEWEQYGCLRSELTKEEREKL